MSIAPTSGVLAELMDFSEGSPEVLALDPGEARVVGTGHHNALYDAAVLHLVLARLLDRLDDLLRDDLRGPFLGASGGRARRGPGPVRREGLATTLIPSGFPEDHERPSAGRVASGMEEATREAFGVHIRTSEQAMAVGAG